MSRTRWYCKKCARGLRWDSKKHDTVTATPNPEVGKPTKGTISFVHDGKCAGVVTLTKDCKRSVTEG